MDSSFCSGTRLARDIKADGSSSYSPLLSLPKALLPIAGVPLLDYWYHDLVLCPYVNIENLFLVTNNFFYKQFADWAILHGIPASNVINDRTMSNESRLGAVGDIALCLQTCQAKLVDSAGVLVIAGDTLFYEDFQISTFLERLTNDDSSSGIVYYNIKDEAETTKRGIIEVDEITNRAIKLLEKPQPSETSSRKACPAFYAYHRALFDDILRYHQQSLSLPLDERDAPGKLLSWLIDEQENHHTRSIIRGYEINGRFDIGNLIEYQQTLHHFSKKLSAYRHQRQLTSNVHKKCYARIGLMGNPSDGFRGKTLSFLIKNFYAEVFIEDNQTVDQEESYLGIHHHAQVEIIAHPEHDPSNFTNMQGLHMHTICKVRALASAALFCCDTHFSIYVL
jgi:glucose-1-phosphate thymidylyltransferase